MSDLEDFHGLLDRIAALEAERDRLREAAENYDVAHRLVEVAFSLLRGYSVIVPGDKVMGVAMWEPIAKAFLGGDPGPARQALNPTSEEE